MLLMMLRELSLFSDREIKELDGSAEVPAKSSRSLPEILLTVSNVRLLFCNGFNTSIVVSVNDEDVAKYSKSSFDWIYYSTSLEEHIIKVLQEPLSELIARRNERQARDAEAAEVKKQKDRKRAHCRLSDFGEITSYKS
jgi:hypothetical protein